MEEGGELDGRRGRGGRGKEERKERTSSRRTFIPKRPATRAEDPTPRVAMETWRKEEGMKGRRRRVSFEFVVLLSSTRLDRTGKRDETKTKSTHLKIQPQKFIPICIQNKLHNLLSRLNVRLSRRIPIQTQNPSQLSLPLPLSLSHPHPSESQKKGTKKLTTVVSTSFTISSTCLCTLSSKISISP